MTEAADRYQIDERAKPAVVDSRYAGMTAMHVRATELASGGSGLPIAWDMLELTNTMPDGTKFRATMRRYSPPTATTPGSRLNTRTNGSGRKWHASASTVIKAVAIAAPVRNVPRTRSGRRAPKFW